MLRYEEYSRVNESWIDTVPSHWQLRRADSLFDYNKNIVDSSTVKQHEQVIHYSIPNVQVYGTGKVETGESIDSNKQIVEGDELLVSKLNPRKGTIIITKQHSKFAVCSTEFICLKAKNINLVFGRYLYESETVRQRISSTVKSATKSHQRAAPEDIYKIWHYIPPLPEQTAIATFLDRKTALIDRAIAQKERLIELLRERQRIVIQRAVTRGLDAGVALKDSGVEWLGEVPAHWEVKSIRYAFTFLNRLRVPISANLREFMAGKYPYYGASGIIDYVNDYIFEEKTILIAEDGANLLSKSTPLAFVADGKYWVNNHAHILRPNYSGFLYWAELLSSLDYTVYISGAAQPKLTRENLGSIRIPVPPSEEIGKISSFLAKINDSTGTAMAALASQITKLKEYRATLIDAAVTGKVRVG